MKHNKNNGSNVPNLRFPEFTGEWKRTTLGNISEYVKDRIMTCSLSPNNYISTENLIQNFQGVGIASSIPTNTSVTSYRVNDILFSNIRPYLKKSWKANMNGGCSTDVFVFRHNIDCLPDFLYYLIANDDFVNYVMTGAKGVKMPRGDKQQITQYPVYLPTKPEQSKITSLLTLIDERISTQNKIIEDLKLLKSAMEERLLSQKLIFNGMSSQWHITTFGQITSNFNRRNKANINYPVYSVTNDEGFIRQSDKFEERVIAGDDLSAYKIIKSGEFAYNPARINVGSIARYEEKDPCVISSLYVCIKPNVNIYSDWLYHLLKSKRTIFYYNMYGEGGVRLYLFYPNFARIKFMLPSYSEQEKIASTLNVLNNKTLHESAILNTYMQQKQYLLQNLFI